MHVGTYHVRNHYSIYKVKELTADNTAKEIKHIFMENTRIKEVWNIYV